MNGFTLMLIIMQTALPLSKQTSVGWLFTFETSTLLEASCFAQLLYTAAAATASACSLEQHQVCTDWKHATVVLMMISPFEEKKRQDYAFRRQFNEKPSIVPGCPGTFLLTIMKIAVLGVGELGQCFVGLRWPEEAIAGGCH